MQYKIRLLKIKSLQYPDKEWDTINHFYMNTVGRKQEKLREAAYSKYHEEELKDPSIDTKREFGYETLLDDNKTLVSLMKVRKEFADFTWEHLYAPEIERGSWDIEIVFEKTLEANDINDEGRSVFFATNEKPTEANFNKKGKGKQDDGN